MKLLGNLNEFSAASATELSLSQVQGPILCLHSAMNTAVSEKRYMNI